MAGAAAAEPAEKESTWQLVKTLCADPGFQATQPPPPPWHCCRAVHACRAAETALRCEPWGVRM